MKFPRQLMAVALTASLSIVGSFQISAHAADQISDKFANWEVAARALGDAGVLYQPRYRVGLKQDGPIEVLAFGKKGNDARPFAQTSVSASFGNTTKNFIIDQKWTNTEWAARPTVSPARRPVGKIKVTSDSGSELTLSIYANCDLNVEDPNTPVRTKCLKRDVLRYGGSLELLTPVTAGLSLKGRNNVVIRSRGLTYAQLVKIATGLEQVN